MNFQKQYELLLNLPPQARAEGSSEAEELARNKFWWNRAESNRRPKSFTRVVDKLWVSLVLLRRFTKDIYAVANS